MRKWQWASVAAILIVMAFARFGRGDGPVSRPQSDNDAIQIQLLQNRIADLERRVLALENPKGKTLLVPYSSRGPEIVPLQGR